MILTIINLLLNPITFVIFFFFASPNQALYFESKGTNTQQLKAVPYIVYCLAFVFTVLITTWVIELLLPGQLNLWEIYQPKYYWLSITGWLVTLFTLKTYLKGMEGNIMGFIFFPMLAISSMALIAVNVSDFFYFFSGIKAPALTLNSWIRLLLHAFLPFYILTFTKEYDNNKKTRKSSWAEPLFASLILQLLFFGINWIVVKLFGSTLTFSQFFGQGQSIIYYLPMFGGIVYYMVHMLSKYTILSNSKAMEKIRYFGMAFTTLLVLLQLLNYVVFIRQCF
jgi:hypothetical protein